MTKQTDSELAVKAINALYQITGSIEKTSNILGVSKKATSLRLSKGDAIPKAINQYSIIDSYWVNGNSLRRAASGLGVSYSTLYRRMKAYGIPCRTK